MSNTRLPALTKLNTNGVVFVRSRHRAVGLFLDSSNTYIQVYVEKSRWKSPPELCYTRSVHSIDSVLCFQCIDDPSLTWPHPSPNFGNPVRFSEETKLIDLKWSNTQGKLSGAMFSFEEEKLVRRLMQEKDGHEGKKFCTRACAKLNESPQYLLQELDMLRKTYLDCKRNNTYREQQRIQKQIYTEYVNDHLYDLIKDTSTKETVKSLVEVGSLIYPIPTLYAKLKHDRVRPVWLDAFFKRDTYIDRIVDDLIVNPDHPSFPSGHSTKVHTVLELVKTCNVRGITTFDDDTVTIVAHWAEEVSTNRERAGLHYKSDTTAGKVLANIIVEDLFESIDGDDATLNNLRSYALKWVKKMGFDEL